LRRHATGAARHATSATDIERRATGSTQIERRQTTAFFGQIGNTAQTSRAGTADSAGATLGPALDATW